VASHLSVKMAERQALWNTFSTIERLEKILSLIEAEIGVLQVERKIARRASHAPEEDRPARYYLNETCARAIQKGNRRRRRRPGVDRR